MAKFYRNKKYSQSSVFGDNNSFAIAYTFLGSLKLPDSLARESLVA
jgi:hypothetical protein